MKVQFKSGQAKFDFQEDDYITIIINYLTDPKKDDLYYHGTITIIEEEGFWAVLDNDKTKEEHFYFLDVENVIPGHLIPFLGGFTRRQDMGESK